MRKAALCLLTLVVLTLGACGDLISWTTDPSARLRFNADTVKFDTVITGGASSARDVTVYNDAEDGLRIAQVRLKKGAESLFRVNVDGLFLAGGVGRDFEIWGKDSLCLRLFVNVPANESDEIFKQEDELIFTLESGVEQRLVLTSSGMNVDILRGEVVSEDKTLTTRRPYQVFDSLVVQEGCTLTLPAGCTLMFHDGAELIVRGTLLCQGTQEKPVILRGDRTDKMFPYLPYDNTPNRWGGVRIEKTSRGNRLEQTDLHSADFGIIADSTEWQQADAPILTIHNSVIHNIGGPGLVLRGTSALVAGSQISNTRGHCVGVTGGDVRFIHCTLAQFYPFTAERGNALFMANREGDVAVPLRRAHFLNCVITGYAEDVIKGDLEEKEGEEKVDYLFESSLLRTEPSDDAERFREIKYDLRDSLEIYSDKHFQTFDDYAFIYDFTPDSLSAIRGLANLQWTLPYATDRLGRDRMADGAPDAGAYECVIRDDKARRSGWSWRGTPARKTASLSSDD